MNASEKINEEIAELLIRAKVATDTVDAVESKGDLPIAALYAQIAQATAQMAIALILYKWDVEGIPRRR